MCIRDRFDSKIGCHGNVPWGISKYEQPACQALSYVYQSWKYGDWLGTFWDWVAFSVDQPYIPPCRDAGRAELACNVSRHLHNVGVLNRVFKCLIPSSLLSTWVLCSMKIYSPIYDVLICIDIKLSLAATWRCSQRTYSFLVGFVQISWLAPSPQWPCHWFLSWDECTRPCTGCARCFCSIHVR